MEIVHKAKATTYAGSAWHQELDFPEPANFGMTITSADSLPLLVYFMSESDFLEITGSGEISEEIMKTLKLKRCVKVVIYKTCGPVGSKLENILYVSSQILT